MFDTGLASCCTSDAGLLPHTVEKCEKTILSGNTCAPSAYGHGCGVRQARAALSEFKTIGRGLEQVMMRNVTGNARSKEEICSSSKHALDINALSQRIAYASQSLSPLSSQEVCDLIDSLIASTVGIA